MKKILTIIILLTSINSYACDNPNYKNSPLNTEYVSTPDMPRTRTITGPFTILQIEKKHTYAPAGSTDANPFGNNYKKWEKFKNLYTNGDKIYFVKHEATTPCCKVYLEKYIIIRNECVISKYLVRSNGIVEGK